MEAGLFNDMRLNYSINNEIKLITEELAEGFRIFKKEHKLISVFGSSRIRDDDFHYSYGYNIGAAVADAGYAVVTGGGPGVMEAAAKGCFFKNGETYGINIKLPYEQSMNPYIKNSFFCNYLFTRKLLLIYKSSGFVVMPGGFGTLDELFEIVTLISTCLLKPVPIVLADSSFWGNLYGWLEKELISKEFITKKELNFIKVFDDPEKIIKYITDFYS